MVKAGEISIVATPIGHLDDMTIRAVGVLKSVDQIAAEDTRHSQRLLAHFGIEKPLVALHDHNEQEKALMLIEKVKVGMNLALISDAGTPLISDPGYHLVRLAHQHGIRIVPIPGPCSIIAALSASGLPTDRFIFEGFLPAKAVARQKRLMELEPESRTLIFFETPHRILESLAGIIAVFGALREATLARELTKTFETIRTDTLLSLLNGIKTHTVQQKGEFVLIVAGNTTASKQILTLEAERILKTLLTELSVSDAARFTAKITGIRKALLYEYALKQSLT